MEMPLQNQVLPGRRFRVHSRLLRHIPDRASYFTGFAGDVESRHVHFPRICSRKRRENLHGSGLSGTIGTKKRKNGSSVYG